MFELDLKEFHRGETIGVALSGGKDSVCLLHALFCAKDRIGIKLCVINVEHGIRGAASIADSAFCKDLAAKYDLPFYSFSVDALSFANGNGLSVEEAARILRYAEFFNAIDKGYCDKIAVAHHLSDSVETILFNIFRGASLSGAKGISAEGYSGRIVRPLLNVSREEVSQYVDKHELSFVQDATNFDTDYTRNALRLDVIPKIKALFPKVETAVSRFASLAKEDDDYLYSLAAAALSEKDGEYFFAADLARPIMKRCVILALKNLGITKDYEKVHVDDVVSLSENISGKKITLPASVLAVRERDKIIIKRKKSETTPTPIPFRMGKTVFGDYIISCERVNTLPEKFGGELYFDMDKLPTSAVFRTREEGDEFTKFGGGTVSLKKYLTDNYFPESKKNVTPVIAFEKKVYCVCEKDISLLIKIDKATKNIIKLTCKKQRS